MKRIVNCELRVKCIEYADNRSITFLAVAPKQKLHFVVYGYGLKNVHYVLENCCKGSIFLKCKTIKIDDDKYSLEIIKPLKD